MGRFVQQAMAIRPEDRFQSAAEMTRELEARMFKLRKDSGFQVRVSRDRPAARQAVLRGSQTWTGRGKRRIKLRPHRGRMAPVVLPMVVPFTVLLALTFAVGLILATGSSTAAAVIIAPLLLGGLVYYRIFAGRKQGPPKF
jgi:hypothetical protein